MAENKMAYVAAEYGKRLDERFTIDLNGCRISCAFTQYGLNSFGAYDNPYIDVDANILTDLLTGEAVIVDD